ncbi:MAG: hypothetical protein KC414_14730 [Romboutsia sp.]|nr:hypothetical protein [Romboutsia sp.]
MEDFILDDDMPASALYNNIVLVNSIHYADVAINTRWNITHSTKNITELHCISGKVVNTEFKGEMFDVFKVNDPRYEEFNGKYLCNTLWNYSVILIGDNLSSEVVESQLRLIS